MTVLDLFVIEDVAYEATGLEEGLRNHIAGIPGADTPIRVKSVGQMVGLLLARAMAADEVPFTGPAGRIRRLFIAGHGGAGEQAVGIGKDTDNTGAKVLKATGGAKLAGAAAAMLPQIAFLFAP